VPRRALLIAALLAFFAIGCTPSPGAYDTARYRFGDEAASILLVSVPDHLSLATLHPTLAGPKEVNIETTFPPVVFNDVAAAWPMPLARTLGLLHDTQIVAAGSATKWVQRLDRDPRRDGVPGYRLLLSPRARREPRDPFAPPPPRETDLNDPRGAFALVRGEKPLDNLPRSQWYAFDPEDLSRRGPARQLLLVSLEYVSVWDTPPRPQIRFGVTAFVVDLFRPLLAASFADEFTVDAAGLTDVQPLRAGSLDALQADDWRALRDGLAKVGERYGFVLAHHLGWIETERLDEEKARWADENARRLRELDALEAPPVSSSR
jgi:hypothetical protein